jgi:hypothetical protein
MEALILQLLGLAIQYGPELGIEIKSAFERLSAGEKVEDLIAELAAKRDDLKPLDFGEEGYSNR